MTNHIEQLSAKLEELDKRLKALSTTQNISIAVMNMRDYIHETKTFLSDLLSAYQNHISTSNNYSQQIENLQTQLNQISQKIDSILSAENFDPNQITADIETLQQSFATLSAESADAIQNLQNQISQSSENITNLSTALNQTSATANQNQADIADLTTQTANLKTTQTNLSTTQTNLTATVTNLNSRLTSAEQEITALNGGVDLTELSEKVTAIENGDIAINYYSFNKDNYMLTPADKNLYTKINNFSCNKECSLQYYDLTYESNGDGILTIELYNNDKVVNIYSINLALNPSQCRINYEYIPQFKGQTSYLKLTSTVDIKYISLTFGLHGKNTFIYETCPNVCAYSFNGKIYVTQLFDGYAKFGKFDSPEEFDLNALSQEIDYSGDENYGGYIRGIYMPIPICNSSTSTITDFYEILALDTNADKRFYKVITQPENSTVSNKNVTKYGNGLISVASNVNVKGVAMLNGMPAEFSAFALSSIKSYTNLENFGEWLCCFSVDRSNAQVGTKGMLPSTNVKNIALNEDGYFYYLYNGTSGINLKLGKGTYARGYVQTDSTINVYITNNKNVYKYNIKRNSSPICDGYTIINDCDVIYELCNDKVLKHVVSNDTWCIEYVPFL